ncbi:NTPase KAP family P-loop domain-containing protein 1-like [Ptychodera flava]|uniref:NTPase KAP family P-loop domain-containing protein 1-like n=1 Tax=Ptychodera flava TaxID=63121 RepID=UPI00396A4FC7
MTVTTTAFLHEEQRFCKPTGEVFTLNQQERSNGHFKLQYSTQQDQYVREYGDGNKSHTVNGWETGLFYQRGIKYGSEERPLVAWKFEFGALKIQEGKIACSSNHDGSLKWRLFAHDESGKPLSKTDIQGDLDFGSSDMRGTSYLILTGLLDSNIDPRHLFQDTGAEDPLFTIDVKLRLGKTSQDKANDLSVAAMMNDVDAIDKLLENYNLQDIASRNSEGDTAVHVAAKCESKNVLLHLLKLRPDLQEAENSENKTPMQCTSERIQQVVQFRINSATVVDSMPSDTERQSIGFELLSDRDLDLDSAGHTKYAKSLANALYSTKLPTPLTIGILGPCGSGKTFLVKLLTRILCKMQSAYRASQGDAWSEFKLLLLILFYYPPPPQKVFDTNETDFIFVKFNAWEYAGSNVLWAGIVTNLVGKIERYAGYWKTRFFRIVAKPSELCLQSKSAKGEPKKISRKTKIIVPIPNFLLLAFLILLFIVGVILAILIGVCEIEIDSELESNTTSPESDSQLTVSKAVIAIEGAIVTVLSMALVTNIKNIVNVVSTLIKSQKAKIESMVNKPNFSDKLGFMADIKREVLIASALINWIARYKKKPVRVVITVDDLDRCSYDKAVDVIDAMKILLSDENSPFICIVAIDPRIVAGAIEKRLGAVSEKAFLTGHEYLKRFLQIRFCVPLMTQKSKRSYLEQLKINASSGNQENFSEGEEKMGNGKMYLMEPKTRQRRMGDNKEETELLDVSVNNNTEDDTFMKSMLDELQNGVLKFIKGCPRSIKNIYNTLCVTAHMVKVMGRPPAFLPSELVLWIVLLDQWPYRSAHMIHFIEDSFEKRDLGVEMSHTVKLSDKLKDICQLIKDRLDKPRDWKMLITLDADPELFEKLLNTEMESFDVEDVRQILPYTIHLDPAIMYSIRHAQAKCDIKNR